MGMAKTAVAMSETGIRAWNSSSTGCDSKAVQSFSPVLSDHGSGLARSSRGCRSYILLCGYGFRSRTLCWRMHLEQAGLDPDNHRLRGRTLLRATLHADRPVKVPARRADVWLMSNRDEWFRAR